MAEHALDDVMKKALLGKIESATPFRRQEEGSAVIIIDPLFSIAISMKRIADALEDGGASFLTHLGGVLSDASHDHAQRMRP